MNNNTFENLKLRVDDLEERLDFLLSRIELLESKVNETPTTQSLGLTKNTTLTSAQNSPNVNDENSLN